MESGLGSGMNGKPHGWRAPNSPQGRGGKAAVRTNLDPYDYQLLLDFCEEYGTSNSYAIAFIVSKVLNLLYDGSGKKIASLDNLTTKEREVSAGNSTIEVIAKLSEQDRDFLIRELKEIKELSRQDKGNNQQLYLQIISRLTQAQAQIEQGLASWRQTENTLKQSILYIKEGMDRILRGFRV